MRDTFFGIITLMAALALAVALSAFVALILLAMLGVL